MLVSANEDLKKASDDARKALVEEQEENMRLTEETIPKLESEIF